MLHVTNSSSARLSPHHVAKQKQKQPREHHAAHLKRNTHSLGFDCCLHHIWGEGKRLLLLLLR